MRSRGRLGLAAGVTIVLLAAAIGAVAMASGDDEQPIARATTTTSSTTTAPTTTLPPLTVDPTRTDVATAALPMIEVFAAPPAGAKVDPRAAAAGAQLASMVPQTSPERANAPAIPTVAAPVKGRRATATGWEFDNPTPWGNPLTFIVTEDHGEWLRVHMPIRPNGLQGWIRASDVNRSTIDTHVEVDVSDRVLRAWAGSTLIVETKVVVGKDSTPTPLGRLYLTDVEEKYRGSAYGPWILPLSGYSQALDEFSGGVPVIAMHGTNRPELVGSAASNGCIRMPDDVIQRLHDTLFLGTPVDIRA
ncbi:MAG: L,D-transpeptidase [Acidimicrobiales bacterium]